MNIEALLNVMRREALRAIGERGLVKAGRISGYDPARYMVKVLLQPQGHESGWLPLASPWVGNGWGLFAPPSIDDLVDVHFLEGSTQAGYVSQRFFSDVDRPQVQGQGCPAGECWLVHASGQSICLGNDGSIQIGSEQAVDVTAPQVQVGSAQAAFLQLLNEHFVALFNNHTHVVASTPDGQLATPTTTPVSPDMLTTALRAN